MKLRERAASLVRKATSAVSRAFRLSDASAYRAAMPDVRTDTGETVNAETALKLSVVFGCVRIIAETIATLPCLVYRKRNGGGRDVDTSHPLYSLLHDSPNADQTAVEFWEMVVASMVLRGRAYVLKSYDANDTIFDLTPLEFDRMSSREVMPSGAIRYTYNHPTRGTVIYTDADVWEVRSFCGMSVIQYGANSMGAAQASERAAGGLFGRDMRPVAVVTRDEFLTRDQRAQVKEAIADGMMRSIDGGPIRLIEGGMKYQQLSLTAQDAQLLETRQFTVEDLCRWFGVPPAMLGHGTAVSNWGTGREQINLGFLQYVLRPYLKRLEQGIWKSLLPATDRRRVYAEFSVEGLLRADSAGRAQYYSTMVQNGLLTRNEVRDLENFPAVEGGDDLTVQSNLVPVALLGQGTTAADAASASIDALKRALGIEDKEHAT